MYFWRNDDAIREMIQYNVGSYGIYSTFDNITESATIVDISVCTFMEKNIKYILYIDILH